MKPVDLALFNNNLSKPIISLVLCALWKKPEVNKSHQQLVTFIEKAFKENLKG